MNPNPRSRSYRDAATPDYVNVALPGRPRTAKPAIAGDLSDLGRVRTKGALIDDDLPLDKELDQYYTCETFAKTCYAIFCEHYDPRTFQMVEPSAGTGVFFALLPLGSLGYDVDPKYPGIETADFLTVEIGGALLVAVIGNPPFGKSASLAVRFFNHAARRAIVIAFIMPRSVRKAAIENRLDRSFHLLREEEVPDHAFLFRGKTFNVPAVFQIWEHRIEPRQLKPVETTHPDFEFTTPDLADFAIQRVGARAGRVHHNLKASTSSHYFIRGPVEAAMRRLDFASVTGNVAGNPSLSKSEIVMLYREWIGRSAREAA